MDAIFKVCDVMENVSLTAATVAPKCFTCGPDTTTGETAEEKTYGRGCGSIPGKFASHDMSYYVDDNSMCTYTVSDIDVESKKKKEPYKSAKKNSSRPPWQRRAQNEILLPDDDEIFTTRKGSWTSMDRKSARSRSSLSSYSKSKQELPSRTRTRIYEETTDSNRTYHTCEANSKNDAHDDTINQAGSDEQKEGQTNLCNLDKSEMDFRLDKIGMDLFALPLHWTHVVRKKSSWSSSSHKTPSLANTGSASSCDDGTTDTSRSRNRRDDYNSLEPSDHQPPPETLKSPAGFRNSPSYASTITRDSASFGKSREFRSFGSNRSHPSLESMASFYSLKPTYMTPRESKLLDEDSSRYRYIIPNPSSDQASTTSSNPKITTKIRVISAISPDTDPIEFHDEEFVQELDTAAIDYSSLAK